MKTMTKDGKFSRVTESNIQHHLKQGWIYCQKSEWKKTIRDFKVTPEAPKKVAKTEKKGKVKQTETVKPKTLTEEGRKILEKGKPMSNYQMKKRANVSHE